MTEKTKTTFAQGQLRALVERIERLTAEAETITGDIKEVYAEAKGNGFDVKILRKVLEIASFDKLQEEEALLEVYLAALGDFAPYGDYRPADRRVVEGGFCWGGIRSAHVLPAFAR
jgi:uncharacterized protein (UPF0335 family)